MTTQSKSETKSKPVKKVIKAATESTNLKTFAELRKEVITNKINDPQNQRKKVALISKLVALYKSDEIDELELELLKELFTRERNLGKLTTANMDLLCEIEVKECEHECYVKTDDTPPVHGLVRDTLCKYTFDPMTGRNKAGEIEGRYIVFVPKVISGDAQLSLNDAIKRDQGKDYFRPADRTVWRRIPCNKKEFEAWFSHNDEEILNGKQETDEDEFVI